jgi:antitoxin ParD1/3/4
MSYWQRLTYFAITAILGIIALPRFPIMPMNISLTPHLEEMIRQKIASGSYNSASEVVREALRLLEQEDQLRSLKMQKLRHDIREGLDSGPSTVFDPKEIKRIARERKSAKSAK